MLVLPLRDKNNLHPLDIKALYGIFEHDFITNKTYLTNGTESFEIDVRVSEKCPCPNNDVDKQKSFWHIITKKISERKSPNNPCLNFVSERNRVYCGFRASRLPWIKYTIDNWQDPTKVDHYYENDGEKLVLWLRFRNFLVILKRIDDSGRYLVTSYIMYQREVKNFVRKLNKYNNIKPTGVEWL